VKTMAYEVVGQVVVMVVTSDPPSTAEWDAYIAAVEAFMQRVPGGEGRYLTFSAGGGPSQRQRQQLYAVVKGRSPPTAVVTSNAFVRTIVGAMSVFNSKIKVFKPEATTDAFRYLGISELEGKAVSRSVLKLQAELGLVSGRMG